MNPFTSIPAAARKWLYLAYGSVAMILGGADVYGLEDIGALDVTRSLATWAYVGIVMGFTAASNVPSYQDVVEGDVPPPDQAGYGAVELLIAVVVAVILLVVLFRLI